MIDMSIIENPAPGLRLVGRTKERIAALIPALDAERSLGDIVRGTRNKVELAVVIDDGSHDRTSAVARACGAMVLRHATNRGKGGALKTGFAYALENGFDGVVTLDADGQHLPDEIPKLLRARRETRADLIIGGRAHHFDGMTPRRRMANRFSAWAIAKASGTGVTDSQSGFRFYSAELLRNVKLRTDGFALESEVIVRAGRRGYQIVTVPIELGFVAGEATSHYRPVHDTVQIAWTVFRTRLH
jgi:glycosyltransferase involved in cell wall biosynthesis